MASRSLRPFFRCFIRFILHFLNTDTVTPPLTRTAIGTRAGPLFQDQTRFSKALRPPSLWDFWATGLSFVTGWPLSGPFAVGSLFMREHLTPSISAFQCSARSFQNFSSASPEIERVFVMHPAYDSGSGGAASFFFDVALNPVSTLFSPLLFFSEIQRGRPVSFFLSGESASGGGCRAARLLRQSFQPSIFPPSLLSRCFFSPRGSFTSLFCPLPTSFAPF